MTTATVSDLAALVLQRGREFVQRKDRDLGSPEAAEKTAAYLEAVESFCDALPADDRLPAAATLDQVHAAAVRYAGKSTARQES